MNSLDEIADRVVHEARELTESGIAASPGTHPLIRYGLEPPRAPAESEAAFLEAAHAFVDAGMNSLSQDMLTASAFKIVNHGARLWVSVNENGVALVLELNDQYQRLAWIERATFH
jgi:hypothetical protein